MSSTNKKKNIFKLFVICIISFIIVACYSAIKVKDEVIQAVRNEFGKSAIQTESRENSSKTIQQNFKLCLDSAKWMNKLNTIDTSSFTDRNNHNSHDIAAFLCKTGHLPSFYMTKNNCKILNGEIDCVNPHIQPLAGHMIGGDVFKNTEDPKNHLRPLPDGFGYNEADVDYDSTEKHRGFHRLVYRFDDSQNKTCYVYYTTEHYKQGSFCIYPPTTKQ